MALTTSALAVKPSAWVPPGSTLPHSDWLSKVDTFIT